MRGANTWTKATAAALAAAAAFAAHAAPGNGIRLGGTDTRLHPFVDLETRYDSNVTYDAASNAVGATVLHVRPGFEIRAPGELAAFEFSGAVDWAEYFGGKNTGSLPKLYANAGLAAAFNRSGLVSPRIDNTFTRQASSTSLAASAAAVVSNQNTLLVSVPWKPGGGALVLAASGQWMVESYEKYTSAPGAALGDLGYNQYRGGAELQWRFLPRTSGVLQAGYYARLPNASKRPGDASGYDVMAGVTGLMTPRISATARAGFGAATAKDGVATVGGASVPIAGGTSSSALADVNAEWAPVETLALRVGYARSLGLDPTVSAYSADGVNGGFRVKLADRILARAGVRWDHMKFTSASVSGATSDFLRIDPGIDGQFGRWLSAGVGYVFSSRAASWKGAISGPPSYSKHEAFLKLGLTY